VAERLYEHHLLKDWKHARIVHLGPVADEVDSEMIHFFNESLIGLTPQGWMRKWDDNGHVQAKKWPLAASIFPMADAVILSKEDLIDDNIVMEFRKWSRLLVLTQGKDGCTVFFENEVKQIPTNPVQDADPTGAGDIFAAAFLIRLDQNGGDPWEAARYANKIATETVKKQSLNEKVKTIEQIVDESHQN
jgi:sugar/nucleoside kinase (ribokinase family)